MQVDEFIFKRIFRLGAIKMGRKIDSSYKLNGEDKYEADYWSSTID